MSQRTWHVTAIAVVLVISVISPFVFVGGASAATCQETSSGYKFCIEDYQIAASSYEPGDTVFVDVTIENQGDQIGTVEATLGVQNPSDSRTYPDVKTVEIPRGEQRTLSLQYTIPNDAPSGTYDVTVDLHPPGGTFLFDTTGYTKTFDVNRQPSSSAEDPTDTTPTIEAGQSLSFTVGGNDPDGDLAGVEWYVDNSYIDTSDLSGSYDEASFSRTFSSPGTYTVEADVFDDSRAYNDQAAKWTVEVNQPTGDLDLTAVDEDGDTVDNAELTLYDNDYDPISSKQTDSSGDASWSNLDTGEYIVELYGPNGDFWGVKTGINVDTDGTSTTIQRKAPRLTGVSLTDKTNGDSTYLVGETINIGPAVRNDGATRDVRVQIKIDKDNDDSAEETVTRGDRSTDIATDDTGYYGYDYQPSSDGTKQIRVVTQAYIDGEWTGTDDSGWTKAFDVQSNTGDLTVSATDASGNAADGGEVILYDSDWNEIGEKTIGSAGEVSWADLDTGQYNLELYGPTGEFWGAKTGVEVTTDSSSETIKRQAPRLAGISLTDQSNGDGVFTVGETVTIGPEVRNDGTERAVRVEIKVDTDNDGTTDTNVTRGDQSTTISSGSTGYYGYDFQPAEPGTKQVRVITEAYLNGNWTITDQSGWVKEFNVVAEDDSGSLPVPRLDRSNGSEDIYVSETVVMGYSESHAGESYEWSVLSGPNESDGQLLHTSSDAPHNGRVTTFRPTEPGTYEIQVTIDGAETQSREVTVKEEAVWNGQSRSDLLKEYAPMLKFHPEEDFYPTRYEAYVENAELNGDTTGDDSLSVDATLLELWKYGDRKQYENLRLQPEGTNYEDFQDPSVYPRTVYGSIHKGVEYQNREYTAIGYWMVYVNDPKPSHVSGLTKKFRHVGDQEPVFVLVNESGPQWVAASQHFGGEVRPWNRVRKEADHPILYPGEGAHSNFFGPYAGQTPTALTTAEDSDESPKYLYQTQYITTYRGLSPIELTDNLPVGYTDRINSDISGDTWAPRSSGVSSDEQYELTHLSGNESWARYNGAVYHYPADADDSEISYRGEIPHQQDRWSSEGLSEHIDNRLFSDYEQTNARLSGSGTQKISITEGEPIGDFVSVVNDGEQPDDFALTVTAVNQDNGDVVTRTYSSFVNTGETRSIQQISSEIRSWETDTDVYTSADDVIHSAWIKPERRSPSIPLTLSNGTWDVEFELSMYDEEIQNSTREPLGTESYEVEVEVDKTGTDGDSIDATIGFIDKPSDLYGPGDDVNATVKVENTGSVEHTFFVGYSAQGPNKQFYDNDGTTGKPVTLAPGETTTVDLSWTVKKDLPGGTYGLVTKVWEESDRNNLQSVLDTEDAEEQIGLPPNPRVEEIRVEQVTDDSIVINATATNVGSTAKWQSLAFSFPGMQDADQVTVSKTNFEDKPLFGEPGRSVGSEYGTNRTELEYLLVEAAANDWGTGETRYLELELSRDSAGQEAYVKSVASADGWIASPGRDDASDIDQQSEYVYTLPLEAPDPQAPTASLNASPDEPTVGETVTLDASGSTDPDGDDSELTYDWSVTNQPSGANVTVPSGPTDDVTLSVAGTYEFEVKVRDTQNLAETATVVIEATEQAPAIPPVGEFDNSPTDPDGDGLYEDVNGDGEVNVGDAQAIFANSQDPTVQNNVDVFDFNGDGNVNVGDAQALFANGIEAGDGNSDGTEA